MRGEGLATAVGASLSLVDPSITQLLLPSITGAPISFLDHAIHASGAETQGVSMWSDGSLVRDTFS